MGENREVNVGLFRPKLTFFELETMIETDKYMGPTFRMEPTPKKTLVTWQTWIASNIFFLFNGLYSNK